MIVGETKKQRLQKRHGALLRERSSWDAHWMELSQQLFPRGGRFFAEDRNKGGKRHNNIYDRTGSGAKRILAAGMMSGVTSPARPWVRLKTPDDDLMKYQPVKVWMAQATREMLGMFARSNTYRVLHQMYEELGAFGTGNAMLLDDYEKGIHLYPNTVGRYALATDYKGNVDTSYRELPKTARQLEQEFGYAALSTSVQNMLSNGNADQYVTIIHAIEPRAERNFRSKRPEEMPWASYYFEKGGDGSKLLRESGFKRFRVLAPRWATSSEDVYGTSPGMEVLGDIKQLQHEQLRKSQGIDHQTRPALQGPSSLKGHELDMLPGGYTAADSPNGQAAIRRLFEGDVRLDFLLEDIRDVRQRIREGMYSDLFLMISQATSNSMTATEVAERHEEKLLMLGPVLERLHYELLDPLVEMTFDRMLEANILPPPPEELMGQNLDVEFVSILAQAQRAIGANSTDRFVGNLGAMAQIKPDVLDKFDSDVWVDSMSDQLGIDPEMIVGQDKVVMIREQRAQQQQAAQAAAAAEQAASTAQKLGTVDTSGKNAASDLMNQLQGYGSPAPYTY